jgi:hypothetical protein
MICGNCKVNAESVASVRACYAAGKGAGFACDWIVEDYGWEGEVYHNPCRAHAVATDRGWTCEAGHEHVVAEVRRAEGWDYAEDSDVRGLIAHGIVPVAMDGSRALA